METAAGLITINAIEETKRKPRKSKSQVRAPKAEIAKKRSGSHDDLLDAEPRRNKFFMCPMFTPELPHHYDTVFDAPQNRKEKKTFLKSIRSNSLAGLLAGTGNLAPDTAELLRDE